MCKFRDLRADEIDVRVQRVTKNGAIILLLYKDARCDMNILDETVGSANWQNRFYEHKGILFCSLGINTNYNIPNAEDRWIWKDDAGVESNTEAEKGNASDARKRSGFAWGIGRELYTSPSIYVSSGFTLDDKGKCKDSFSVAEIKIENKVIIGLSIRNDKTKDIVFTYGAIKAEKPRETSKPKQEPAKKEIEPKNALQEPQMTYAEALEVKVGSRTLREIYKTERAYIEVAYEQGDDTVKQAINIIEAYIAQSKKK